MYIFLMSKILLIALIITIISGAVGYFILSAEQEIVTVDKLRRHPEQYNGKFVKTTGILVSGFETGPALSNEVIDQDGVKYLKDPAIYIDGATVKNKRDCFSEKEYFEVSFCVVDVEGIFEHGGNYGHASFRSKYQIRGTPVPATHRPLYESQLPPETEEAQREDLLPATEPNQ